MNKQKIQEGMALARLLAHSAIDDVKSCDACKYKWIPRVKKPKKCPHCQTWLKNDSR